MTAPRVIPSGQSGYNGCSINRRCFYEGSSKERMCSIESLCIRDDEVRNGQERFHVAKLNGDKEVDDAEGGAQILP